MKKIIVSLFTVAFLAGAAIASPIYEADLRWDCKTPNIQLQQQSGWDYCTEIAPAPKKVAAAPAAPVVQQAKAPEPEVKAPEPVKESPRVVPQKEWILKGVQFETNSDKLRMASVKPLEEAAEVLKENKNVQVEIQGHTDSIGADTYNQDLSQRRANAVKVYLMERGVAENRLRTMGYGETKPIADNSTADGRSDNRRIEFKVLSR